VNLHVDTTARFSNSNTPGTIILAEYSKLDDHSPVTICSLNVICHVYWKMFPYMDLYSCYCRQTLLRARTGYQRRQSWAERESHNCVLRSSNMKTIIMISEHANSPQDTTLTVRNHPVAFCEIKQIQLLHATADDAAILLGFSTPYTVLACFCLHGIGPTLLERSRVHNRTPVFSRGCFLPRVGRTDV